MSVSVNVPQLSESVKEANLLEWKVSTGSRVEFNDIIIEIETEKVVLEIPAPAAGWLEEIVVPSGGAVVSDQLIARISTTPLAKITPPGELAKVTQKSPSASAVVAQKAPGKPAKPCRIFLSYRRDDSIDITDRMFDYMVDALGAETVFKDIDSMPLGYDFRKHLRHELECCTLVVAVIGKDWLATIEETGTSRLSSESDFVRLELEFALSRDKPVVPVLVGGAVMPLASNLPASLQDLLFCHGTSVRSGPHFRADMDHLIRGLRHHLPDEA